MAKYSKYTPNTKPRKKRNPIWRGIGCLLMIFIPVVSYWIADFTLQLAKSKNLVPSILLGHFQIPEWSRSVRALTPLFSFLHSLQDLWAFLIFFFVILLLISGLISLTYSFIYQLIGPSRYSELDSPPENRKAREYKR